VSDPCAREGGGTVKANKGDLNNFLTEGELQGERFYSIRGGEVQLGLRGLFSLIGEKGEGKTCNGLWRRAALPIPECQSGGRGELHNCLGEYISPSQQPRGGCFIMKRGEFIYNPSTHEGRLNIYDLEGRHTQLKGGREEFHGGDGLIAPGEKREKRAELGVKKRKGGRCSTSQYVPGKRRAVWRPLAFRCPRGKEKRGSVSSPQGRWELGLGRPGKGPRAKRRCLLLARREGRAVFKEREKAEEIQLLGREEASFFTKGGGVLSLLSSGNKRGVWKEG